jgi:hydroxymethylcytosylglucuronate/cytosylglucuronate synthase
MSASIHSEPPVRLTVALCGVEFGWGSAGKLGAIIDALRLRCGGEVRFVGLGSRLGREVVRGHGVEEWHDVDLGDRDAVGELLREQRIDVAVAVLDRFAATALEDAGCPVVFVDSLPFLWTEEDADSLPLRASAYCAQLCLGLPAPAWPVLARIEHLHWVESVVLPSPLRDTPQWRRPGAGARPAGERRAVVSLGGLLSPLLSDPSDYLRLVVPAALRALADWGVAEATLCGNLPEGLLPQLRAAAPEGLRLRSGALGHRAFLDAVDAADVLLASPGLTTLLEASARGVPVVCLPPQNISQILNASYYTQATGAAAATWPTSVFDAQQVLDARLTGDPGDGDGDGDGTGSGSPGEDAALELVYGGISRAAADPDPVRAELAARIRTCLAAVDAGQVQGQGTDSPNWSALARLIGTGGARQVATAVLNCARPARTGSLLATKG